MLESKYTKSWDTFNGFDSQGQALFETETQTLELNNFEEYFIHYLNDYLPTIDMNPDGDGLDRLQQFKDLYIQCRLDAQREYIKDHYSPP
jgi:hypothetical protein